MFFYLQKATCIHTKSINDPSKGYKRPNKMIYILVTGLLRVKVLLFIKDPSEVFYLEKTGHRCSKYKVKVQLYLQD